MFALRLFPVCSAFALGLAFLIGPTACPGAEAVSAEALLQQAHAARQQGKPAEALQLAKRAAASEATNVAAHALCGKLHAELRQPAEAVTAFTRALELMTNVAGLHQLRGAEYFKLGRIAESLADFDTVVRLDPKNEPHNWQRGIAQYYAGRFEAGRKQFELHQTVNANDVENAAWHYLCVARQEGAAKARERLIPIEGDARVPLMQIHALYAGKTRPEDVLSAASAGQPAPARLREQLFYAHLYLGLYYEAAGEAKSAREHLAKAAGEFSVDHYMGDVVRVHLRLLDARK